MPAIRLADIPNAGPQALGPSNIGIGSPSVPRFAINPQVAQLTGAASLDPNALAGAAKQMQLDTYNLNAFSGEAAGLANIGDALGDVATVGFRFSRQMQDAKDNTDYQQAKTVLESAWQKQLAEQETVPFAKWGENFQKNLATAKTALSEIKFSNRVAGKINQEFDAFAETRGIMINGLANKRQIDDFQKITEIAYKRELAKGNLEGAFSVINTAEKDGTYGKSDAEAARLNVEVEQIRNAKEERNANVASTIIQNPVGAEADLEKAIETGKSKMFPELTEQSDIVRAYSNARSEASVYRNNIEDDLDQLILSGELTKPEDIRRLAEGILPERRILSAIETLTKTPAEIEKALAMRPTLLAMVDAYDANKDDKNRSEYLKIKDSIRQLPEGERGELLQSLRDKWNNPKDTTPVSEASSQLKTLFTKGQFGTWTEKDGKMPDSEVPKYLAAGKKFAGFKSALENWATANPKEAADQTKVYEKLNEILAADKEVQIPKSGGSSWWYPGSWFAPSKPTVTPDEALKKIDQPPKTSKADSINKKSSKEDIAKAAQEIDFDTPLPEFPELS